MIDFLNYLMISLPLEVFVFIGTVIDEILSPIPAFLVLIPAGAASHIQSRPFVFLLLLAALSAVARTMAGIVLYLIADRLEDILFKNGRKFFGHTHHEIETMGKRLGKHRPYRSWLALFLMHALPVFPGTLLSLGSGFIRLRLRIFITATVAGSFVSAAFFLYVGYMGIETTALFKQFDRISLFITIGALLLLFGWLIAIKYRRNKYNKSIGGQHGRKK